ncbi:hypothetical protein BIU96_10940 [Curtobacterium sp. MCBA15_008]|nr:hypothetical protein BIU96_10940 [Curtobacterium sp. MCBA15_008]
MPEPKITGGPTSFYSQDQIPAVWAAATQAVPDPLPAGFDYPTEPPALLRGDTTAENVYEKGFPEHIAARYWRCAWLDHALSATTSRASKMQAARDAIARWDSFSAVTNFDGLSDYDSKMHALAEEVGKSPFETEFSVDCGSDLYTPGSSK